MREDISMYTPEELSLIVFNTEELYKIRHTLELEDILKETYTFTDEQMEILEDDLAVDYRESL